MPARAVGTLLEDVADGVILADSPGIEADCRCLVALPDGDSDALGITTSLESYVMRSPLDGTASMADADVTVEYMPYDEVAELGGTSRSLAGSTSRLDVSFLRALLRLDQPDGAVRPVATDFAITNNAIDDFNPIGTRMIRLGDRLALSTYHPSQPVSSVALLPDDASSWEDAIQWTSQGWHIEALRSGDLDGDGSEDLVVSDGTGTVFILTDLTTPGTLDGAAATRIVTTEPGARFGRDVAVVDLDHDGQDDLVVAAPMADRQLERMGTPPGRFLVYRGPFEARDYDWREADRVVFDVESEPNDVFATTFAVGDVDEDGQDELVVGSSVWGPGQVGMVAWYDDLL
ncbi:MAG: VCBS repeat-containing protein [Alphaproteobacteria bacterium]|nr:VCBS repeat-containing protein [Alphaproteobacteria bacterium]MCB9694142.1 VCBS repeat-containing protein [Alphaproteobacteria bacterium]